MLDLELLKTFVSVVDAGGFTRAGERVNRTQSTVSQQIRKLEEQLDQPLLLRQRAGKAVHLTEQGERLLGYARRLVELAQEAEALMRMRGAVGAIRLGVPEDFDVQRLVALLSGFAERHPGIRLDTLNGLSVDLQRKIAERDLDLALVKRDAGSGPALARWPEKLHWVAGTALALRQDPLPLLVFGHGCLYRNRAIHAIESSGRRWRIAFTSQSLPSIQAAVSANLGISLLPSTAVQPDHRVLTGRAGFAAPPPTELALIGAARLLPTAQQALVDYLVERLPAGT
jgi:DNA-binding transcriptional LysR family regulator